MNALWTEAEIADMEADDGRVRVMPLTIRRLIADQMREQNAGAERLGVALPNVNRSLPRVTDDDLPPVAPLWSPARWWCALRRHPTRRGQFCSCGMAYLPR